MSVTVRPHRSWDGPAVLARLVELATAGYGVQAVAEKLNREGVPTLHLQVVGADANGMGGSVAFAPDLRGERRWTASRVHEALRQRAVERFDSMPLRDKVGWIDRLAVMTKVEPSKVTMLGHEVRAFARSVGLGFAWAEERRALSGRDVCRIHDAIREGFDALRQSKHVPTFKATETQAVLQAARRAKSAGWVLPRHRIRLRRFPSPARGEETSIYAVYEAPDEVSAIVAAIGHFIWRHADRWRDCECGCGLMFPVNGKQRFIEEHGGRHRQKKHYWTNRDRILQERRQRTAGEAEA